MSSTASAQLGELHGEQAIWLHCGRYEAAVLPEIGGNLIAFRDIVSDYRFIHEPKAEEMESFKTNPILYGIPVLFPPNRYEDGRFPWNGQLYTFPVNEPARGNHLHGFLYNIPWTVEHIDASLQESSITLVQQMDDNHPMFAYFPYPFTFRLKYSLSKDGLSQHAFLHNNGSQPLPIAVAFHTNVNAPFAPESTPADCRFSLTVGERYEMSERMLPTGRLEPLSSEEEAMKDGSGISPYFAAMDNHYTAAPQNGRNRMVLMDSRCQTALIYDAGNSYKHWMVYNNNADNTAGFFCPEPQMNIVNAPNLNWPLEQTALYPLSAGEIWEETSRLYSISAKKSMVL